MLNCIGVIGTGQMGIGIAHIVALSGASVKLMDIDAKKLNAAVILIEKNMRRQVDKSKISDDDMQSALARIEYGDDYKFFNKCDLVIESASENEEIKRDIFKKLTPHLNDKAIIATNTSSISITRLAANTDRPDRFCGIHFMKPVPSMKLVELIRGLATSEESFKICKDFAENQLGKTVAIAEDFPGFIVNRILLPMVNEAIYTLYEGVGNVAAIDRAMKLGANHPLGPLELADYIGLDTCLAILNVLYSDLADPKYRPCPLLAKYVEAGWLGVKNGRGFYDYSTDTPRPTR